MTLCVRDRNADALRTQSSHPRISSALSASPRFRTPLPRSPNMATRSRPVVEPKGPGLGLTPLIRPEPQAGSDQNKQGDDSRNDATATKHQILRRTRAQQTKGSVRGGHPYPPLFIGSSWLGFLGTRPMSRRDGGIRRCSVTDAETD